LHASLDFKAEALDPNNFDLTDPDQSVLAELFRSDFCDIRYLPAVGNRFANRALDLFPRASSARIVFQPSIPFKSSIEKFHIKVVKNPAFDVQLVYITAWMGIARVGSSTHTLRLRITSCHHASLSGQQSLTIGPLTIGRREDSEYADLVHRYPAFRAHHDIFKSMLIATHESLQSLASASCMRAFELTDKDSHCERLRTVNCEVMQAPSKGSKRSDCSDTALWNALFKDAHTALRIGMDRQQYEESLCATREPNGTSSAVRRAYVALGGNVGDRTAMIETACLEMNIRCIKLLRTSHLYETEPMYLKTQQSFINGVCEVSVPLLP